MQNIEFDKYFDLAALLKIKQNDKIFIGWFFKYTDELNLYSNKNYEISLLMLRKFGNIFFKPICIINTINEIILI